MRSSQRLRHLKTKVLLAAALVAGDLLGSAVLHAEICTTQSQMKPAQRDVIAATASALAAKIEANDAAGVRLQTVPEYATNFSAMSSLIGSTAAKITGAPLYVEQVYLLDASSLKTLADGTKQDAQFFCSLNKSIAEAEFLIPALPPGRYAFVMVVAANAKAPWRLSFLLQQAASGAGQAQGSWLMAGFYPKAMTAAGHDGLWYWTQARDLVKSKQLWTAYLYYEEAQVLLQPAGFVSSTHLDKLRKEAAASAPPALSEGISVDAPLVIRGAKGPDGKDVEYRFTDLTTDDSFGADKIDVVVHLAPDPPPDASPDATKPDAKTAKTPEVSPRDRNSNAMAALLAAYPELRNSFHGVWVFADSPGKTPFVTEEPMANIH